MGRTWHAVTWVALGMLIPPLTAGCKDDSAKRSSSSTSAQATAEADLLAPGDPKVTAWLLELVRSHGMPAEVEGEWVRFEGTDVTMNAATQPEDPAGRKPGDT